MNEKTERLRDIFLTVADDATVTERQEELRGSLTTTPDAHQRLREVIERMHAEYDFQTSLATDELVTLVQEFYAGKSDTAIARAIGDKSRAKTVTRARIALHLVTDQDLDAPFPLDDLRELLADDLPTTEIADRLDVSPSTVRRYRRILAVQAARRAVGDRYRAEFERILADRELSDSLTRATRETGLEDATEGMETNVSF